ncbi:hypothetical protein VHUM_03151 [Vanrija humicola]|uniref:Fumarylacetoacetase-like C-terminal domain-containing protein n=1 Tax=Vanrija humicola TaxID=5417 RepID=A0A7D8UY98_VANHU|nr:hypothetical protein VHUM_03151 [Vanrija humicola]
MSSYARLVRFIPTGSSTPVIGEPVDAAVDVGIATYEGKPVEVNVLSGSSVLSPGERTGKTATVDKLLSPLAAEEVGTIRCIGLNYVDHAKEAKLPIPTVPTVFYKPATALADPYPAPTVIPKAFVADDAADYEAEFVVVLGKKAKDVSEADAWDYVAGYTAANDVSSRTAQFATSQWSFSKSFDGSCPIGPAFVPASQVKDVGALEIRGELNGKVVQRSKLDDLIFGVPRIVSHLSQGTTLLPGTVIITGTPAGVGFAADPKTLLRDGGEFRVFLSGGVGTLINKIVEEK